MIIGREATRPKIKRDPTVVDYGRSADVSVFLLAATASMGEDCTPVTPWKVQPGSHQLRHFLFGTQ